MTPLDLARLRELAQAATPGPWHVSIDRLSKRCLVLDAHNMWVADCGEDQDGAFLIAAARTALPALLDEIERLRRPILNIRCACTNEPGDSDCAVHSMCPDCGETLYETQLYGLHERLATVTRERDEARASAEDFNLQRVTAGRRMLAAEAERDEARADLVALLQSERKPSLADRRAALGFPELTADERRANVDAALRAELAAARDVLDRYPATVILWEQATADRERLTAELAAAQAERDEAVRAFTDRAERRDEIKKLADRLAAQGNEAIEQRDAARREVEGMRSVVEAALAFRDSDVGGDHGRELFIPSMEARDAVRDAVDAYRHATATADSEVPK